MAGIKDFAGVARAPFLLLPPTLVASGGAAAAWDGSFSWLHTIMAVIGLVVLHMAVNILNEWSDMRTGIDLETERTPFSGGSGTLPAGGIVLMPEASSSCTCAYSFQTSLALIADDRHEHWGAYTCEPPKRGSQLKTVSFNFGGVGDKRDKNGKLWLGFPRPFSPQNLRVPFSTCEAADYYRENADEITVEAEAEGGNRAAGGNVAVEW